MICEPLERRALLAAAAAAAVDIGAPDPTYGDNGKLVFPRPYFDDYFHTGHLAADGSTITAVASYQRSGGEIVRFRLNGSIDRTWGHRGVRQYFYRYRGHNIEQAMQPDGKFLQLYHDFLPSSSPQDHITRYLPDGDRDPSFGIDGKRHIQLPPAAYVNALLLLPDGKILIGASHGGDKPTFILQRLLPDGKLDRSYGVNGQARVAIPEAVSNRDLQIDDLLLAPDGKVVIVGSDDGYDYRRERVTHPARVYVARVLTSGKADKTFGDIGGVAAATVPVEPQYYGLVYSAAFQGDGILIGLRSDAAPLFFRFTADGEPDASFGNAGLLAPLGDDPDDEIDPDFTFAVQPNGGIVLATRKYTSAPDRWGERDGDVLVARLKPGGALDMNFGDDGLTQTHFNGKAYPGSILLQKDGGILVLGSTDAGSPPSWGMSLFAARYFGSAKTKPANMPIERPTYTRAELKALVDNIATNDPTFGFFIQGDRTVIHSKAIDAVVKAGPTILPFLLARMKRDDLPFDTFARIYTAADQIISSVDASLGPVEFPGADLAGARLLPVVPDVKANRNITIGDLTRKIRRLRASDVL